MKEFPFLVSVVEGSKCYSYMSAVLMRMKFRERSLEQLSGCFCLCPNTGFYNMEHHLSSSVLLYQNFDHFYQNSSNLLASLILHEFPKIGRSFLQSGKDLRTNKQAVSCTTASQMVECQPQYYRHNHINEDRHG